MKGQTESRPHGLTEEGRRFPAGAAESADRGKAAAQGQKEVHGTRNRVDIECRTCRKPISVSLRNQKRREKPPKQRVGKMVGQGTERSPATLPVGDGCWKRFRGPRSRAQNRAVGRLLDR